ncbi:MazG family protein [Nocardioidaceae bacterium]|nr:MazG family protein [Nocardioidaceae bacterium]
MDRLRSECAWKASQTHESLVRYLVEEAYEVVDALETGDADDVAEELGDLLLQVVFHARIAEEGPQGRTPFGAADVARGITAKLRRRNPHVFGEDDRTGLPPVDRDDAAAVNARWEQVKATEKRRESLMEGVPSSLPALLTALKAVERLERSADGPTEPTDDDDEIGEQLWRLVERAHAEGTDPEQALREVVRRRTAGR